MPNGSPASISQLPTVDLVVDYFRWRSEDAHRNALNSHCYWMLRKGGLDAQQATKQVKGLGDKPVTMHFRLDGGQIIEIAAQSDDLEDARGPFFANSTP